MFGSTLPAVLVALFSMHEPSKSTQIFVVFGKPGSGKSTVANAAIELLSRSPLSEADAIRPVGLDLDVCVPQWMRDNFAKGIYPSLNQREEFAASCCDYVDQALQQATTKMPIGNSRIAAVVSFSFVNEDIRYNFRTRFSESQWVLVDTSEDEAQRRIEQRQGHFYKGKALHKEVSNESEQPNDVDNKEWDFAPVTFPHTILDGKKPIGENAAEIAKLIRRAFYISNLFR